jgi:hypothetical protein
MTAMPRKCARRAPWKVPNRSTSQENWTGFHTARPVMTCITPATITTR